MYSIIYWTSAFMLSADVKTQIRTIYKGIASALPNFRSRREQNYIVAEISKTLAGEYDKQRRIIVVEAGTGIGKSLAYILGTIPLALANKKRSVSRLLPSHYKSNYFIKICLFSATLRSRLFLWPSQRTTTLCVFI